MESSLVHHHPAEADWKITVPTAVDESTMSMA